MAVSFIGGGNKSNPRKQQTCHKSLTNVITVNPVLRSHHWDQEKVAL